MYPKHSTKNKMKRNIVEITDIRFGYYIELDGFGDTPYLQARQFNEQGMLLGNDYEYIRLDEKSKAHLLKDGDILFVGKGNRLFAWCYRESEGPFIASSIFFVLRPDQKVIFPEYLAAVLNAPQTKAVFQQLGSGTNIFSIRKSELGAFQIPVPEMEKQKKIAVLAEMVQKEISLTNDLLKQRQSLYSGIISTLL